MHKPPFEAKSTSLRISRFGVPYFARIFVMAANDFPDAFPQFLPGNQFMRRMAGEYAEDGTPLYAASEGSPRGVPTGRVLVRFEEGIRFEDRAASFAGAGFTIDDVLSYAPHAGWVRAASGSIADALRGVEDLAGLADVRHVEPQVLYRRTLK